MESNGSVRPSRPQDEDPRVTVVVVSRNRRDELLRSLGHHRAPVVLVDNGSTDGSAEAVRRAYPDVEVVELGRNLGAAARTVGVGRARTPMVAFADDDSWWTPGSLRAAADALAGAPRVGLVTVEVRVGESQEVDPFTRDLAASPLRAPGRSLPGLRVLGFMGCAAMVRRSAFLAAGGFDDVVRFPGEEERLAWDLSAAGWDLVFLDGPVVRHFPSPRRDGTDDRRRGIARARVLTTTMRLPWRRVAARVAAELRAGPGPRRGVLDAAQDLRAALPRREVLPRHVLADLDTLAAVPAPQGVGTGGR
ncbi:GT2 family glycosyltransferase [Isoptericola sp. CG 20/1183]|uniref:GT2 family glycosyltransferase n=1 Tax=Isoptericola halotolerans TaxID=300560 RepID=A0ABX5EHP4_9MICO|nr:MULTISPECIES: glycosyltransferase [Isoptericola]PRZ02938.1 GT2 family glycosyltransferase [Isoptericola sp. CG 20/1183]PRZ09935.1 GT2 family glycosyltransferase [Isoptericola halotolerans]